MSNMVDKYNRVSWATVRLQLSYNVNGLNLILHFHDKVEKYCVGFFFKILFIYLKERASAWVWGRVGEGGEGQGEREKEKQTPAEWKA